METKGKLFRVDCGSLIAFVKFLGVDQDSFVTPSPTRTSEHHSTVTSTVTSTIMSTSTARSSSTRSTFSNGTTQMPKKEHGHWYVGVGVGVGVVVVLGIIIVFLCKRKKRGVVYGGIELGSINGGSEEETPL